MKAFFEEYGFVMLSAVVVLSLIVMAGNLKGTVESGITDVMNGFKNQIVSSDNKLIIPGE